MKRFLVLMMAFLIMSPSAPLSFAQTTTATTTATNPATVSDDDKRNQQDWVKNNRNYVKDLKREVSDIQRDVKTIDVTKVNDLLGKYEACLTTMEGKVGTQDFWNFTRDCDDISKTFNDELQDNLRPQRDCFNKKKEFDDRKREKKNNIDTQLKDILRNDKNADVSALNPIITKMTDTFAKADQLTNQACNRDINDTLNDLSRDLNDLFQEWYSTAGEVSQKTNDARQLEDNRKDFEKNIKRQCEKDIGSQMKQYDKDYQRAKKDGTVSAEAEESYQAIKEDFEEMCVTQIAAMQAALTANNLEDFNDERQTFSDLQQDFYESMNDGRNLLNQQQQVKDVLKEIANREKDLERMKKDAERASKKAGTSAAQTEEIFNQLRGILEKAKQEVPSDPQVWWNDYQMEYTDLQDEFWQSFQKVEQASNVKRWFKDVENELKFREKDLKNWKKDENLDQGVISKLEGILGQMREAIVSAGKYLEASDPEAAEEALRSMDDLRFGWDDTSRSLWERQQMSFNLDQVKREISHAKDELGRLLKIGKISEDEAKECFDFIEFALGKVREVEDADGNIEELQELEQEAFDACPILEKLGPAQGPGQEYYQGFVEQNLGLDEAVGKIAAGVLEKISGDIIEKVMGRLLSDSGVVESLFSAAGEKYKNAMVGSLEGLANFYGEDVQKDLLAKKTEILELTQKLDNLQKQVQIAQDKLEDLQKIQDEVAGYNFYGTAGDQIRDDIEAFLSQAEGLSKDQIRSKIDELKGKKDDAIRSSKDAKYEANIIPFHDTDDNEWFTKFAAQVKQRGLVQGTGTSGGKEFNPGGLTNVAEAITMFARIIGIDDGALPVSKVGQRLPDWAKAAAGTLDEEGVGLDDIFGGKNPGDTVSRGEVARLLKQVLHLEDVDSGEADIFSDIKLANGDEKDSIAAVFVAGIMTGQGGEGPKVFDVKGPLNRAALAKILTVVPIGE